MATSGQHQQAGSAPSGAGQTIVELCGATDCGIIFWSRQRFEIGAELQIRMRCDVMPSAQSCDDGECEPEGWKCVRGFVVECEALRRENGSCVFRVSLLLDSTCLRNADLHQPAALQTKSPRLPVVEVPVLGRTILGLN